MERKRRRIGIITVWISKFCVLVGLMITTTICSAENLSKRQQELSVILASRLGNQVPIILKGLQFEKKGKYAQALRCYLSAEKKLDKYHITDLGFPIPGSNLEPGILGLDIGRVYLNQGKIELAEYTLNEFICGASNIFVVDSGDIEGFYLFQLKKSQVKTIEKNLEQALVLLGKAQKLLAKKMDVRWHILAKINASYYGSPIEIKMISPTAIKATQEGKRYLTASWNDDKKIQLASYLGDRPYKYSDKPHNPLEIDKEGTKRDKLLSVSVCFTENSGDGVWYDVTRKYLALRYPGN